MKERRWKRREAVPMQEQALETVLAQVAKGGWQRFDTVVRYVERLELGQALSEAVWNLVDAVVGDAELLKQLEVADLRD